MGVGIAPKQGRNPWWRRGLVAALVCGALAGVAVFVDRVVIGPPLPPAAAKTPRLKQIPVSSAACADVSDLRDAAGMVRVEMDYATAGFAAPAQVSLILPPPRPVRVSWQSSRSRLDRRFRTLDSAIERATPNFPAAIRQQFTVVRRDIAVGRRELATSESAVHLLSKNGAVWSDAVRAFSSASDLVGSQCGTPLGAGEPLFGPCSVADCTTP